MLQACCECVTKMLRTWLLATSNIRSLSSLLPHVVTMLRLYWGYVATRVACNIQLQEPLLPSPQPNTTCLQHRNATSATLKNNVCNTQQHMYTTSRLSIFNIEKLMIVTSKNLDLILKHSHETLAICQEHGCNMCAMICNINKKQLYHEDDRLQHVKNIVTTPIYNICNIKNKK
jgi:hypothetical protein